MKTPKLLRCLTTIIIAMLALIASMVALAENATNTGENWLHFGYDDAYTAYNPLESTLNITNVVKLERKWGLGCGNDHFGSIARVPAIYNDMLYASGMSSGLNAYDARTGALQWQFGTGSTWMPQPVVSEDGVVFYMEETLPTYLFAVNGQTGAQLWKAPLGFELGFSGASEAVVTVDEANDLVYLLEVPFGSEEGKLYALDMQTGDIAWYMDYFSHEAGFKNNYALLRDDKLYAAAEIPATAYPFKAEHMLRIDPMTQTIELTYTLPVSGSSYFDVEQFTLCNDRLVVGYDYQYDPTKFIVGYDPDSSAIKWQKPFPSTITGKLACNTDTKRIYVPTDPYLYALDATTGAEVWKYQGYNAIYNPSIANGIVYFLSDNNMYAVDEATGNRLLHYPLGHAADETSQVAIVNGMVYFSGNIGTCDLFALWSPKAKIFLPIMLQQ